MTFGKFWETKMDNKNIGINLNILELNGPNFERKEKKNQSCELNLKDQSAKFGSSETNVVKNVI